MDDVRDERLGALLDGAEGIVGGPKADRPPKDEGGAPTAAAVSTTSPTIASVKRVDSLIARPFRDRADHGRQLRSGEDQLQQDAGR